MTEMFSQTIDVQLWAAILVSLLIGAAGFCYGTAHGLRLARRLYANPA